MSTQQLPAQRLARRADAPRLSELMRASILSLFPHFYDARQTASAAVYIGELDMTLVDDGTYFVHEAGDEIVACGGWSRRDKLYTGSGDADGDARLLDPAHRGRAGAGDVRPRGLDAARPGPGDPRLLRARRSRRGLRDARR